MHPRLRLFGGVAIEQDGAEHHLALDRPVSLLVYLALRGDWVSRSELALLYRPDAPEDEALGYLRKLVFRARRLAWAEGVEVSAGRVRWRAESDVTVFLAAAAAKRWGEALAAYRGPFLAGAAISGAPGFSTWQEIEREALAARWTQAAVSRAAELSAEGRSGEAAELLGRVVEAEPLAEENLQAYLRALAGDGREREALKAYERFRRELENEVDGVPLESTRALADSLREAAGSATPAERAKLPEPPMGFVGRGPELARLAELLARADARLVNIVGLGGSGKTRLAIEAARRYAGGHPAGATFVSLAAVTEPEGVPRAIIEALGLPWEGDDSDRALLDGLREARLLLVLDNFEGVVEAAPLLIRLLEAAPGVRLLVTSREALRVSGEWLVYLGGLETPRRNGGALSDFDAVRLFVQRSVRVTPQFAATDAALEAIAHICRQLDGLPLAIELAASWTRLLPLAELREQLARPGSLLTTEMRDLPERHRSLWRVFDHTWERLTAREREALARLTTFRGGFTLDAATEVAHADLELLLGLLDRTLVRRQEEGRFALHELVRQYAEWRTTSAELEVGRAAHAGYFCRLLASLAPDLKGLDVPAGLMAIQAESANFEAAWDDAVKRADLEALENGREALDYYFYYRARYGAAVSAFGRAATALEPLAAAEGPRQREANRLRGRLLLQQAEQEFGSGRSTKAGDRVDGALEILSAWGSDIDVAHARLVMANGLVRASRYAEAEPHYRAVLASALAGGDSYLEGAAYNGLANLLSYVDGDIARAEEYYRASLRAHRRVGNLEGVTGALTNLGACRFDLHDFAEAERLWGEAAATTAALGYRQREAVLLNNLGSLAKVRGDLAEAERLFQRSLKLRREIGDVAGVANVLHNVGRLALQRGDPNAARGLLQEALDLYLELDEGAGVAHVRSSLTRVLTLLGRVHEAREQAALSLELALAIDSRSDLLSGLLAVALLHERQGDLTAAADLARAVARGAAGTMEPLRAEAEALAQRLDPGSAGDPTDGIPAADPSVIAMGRQILSLLRRAHPNA